jgi:hypothetical protein
MKMMLLKSDTVPPLHVLPKHPYSKDEILDYVDRYFHSKLKDKNKKAEAKKRFIHYMEVLPAWVQVLMIENRVPVEVDSVKALRLGRQVVGFQSADTYKLRLVSHLLYGADQEFEYYLSHEIGHNIDNIIGNYRALPLDKANGDAVYFSEMKPGWTRHLRHDLKVPTGRSTRDINRQMRSFLEQNKYKKDEYPRESLAFVLSHYLTEHFRANDAQLLNDQEWCAKEWRKLPDEAAIDGHMQRFFPSLWPYFRDYMLPHGLEIAIKLYSDRHVRQQQAYEHTHKEILDAAGKVVEKYGCKEPASDALIERLTNSYYTEWHSLFEQLAEPLPRTAKERLELLFPAIFDAVWGGHVKRYTLSSFPELKNEATHFAQNVETILRDEGIEAFCKHYQDLWENFEQAIEQRKPKARAR